jgi:three-Cys-motif partner protein
MFHGDCNIVVSDLAREIPSGALTLAFIDPEGLDANFDTIRVLSERGCVDLLILFADAYDIARNVELLYFPDPNSKLDAILGYGSNWREKWSRLGDVTGVNLRKFFADIYKDQLGQHLGYKVFREKTMRSPKGPLYRLVYASKHPRGSEFWDKITKRDRGGQKGLF